MNLAYLKIIAQSFHSPAPYIEAYKNGRGFGLKYFFTVSVIASSILALGWISDLSRLNPAKIADSATGFIISQPKLSFEENITRFLDILQQVPKLKIEDGQAFTEVAQPYFITDQASGRDIAIIDTSGKTKSLEGSDAVLLLTENKLITLDAEGQENILHLRELAGHSNLDTASLNEVLSIIAQVPPFGLYNGKFVTKEDKLYKIFDKDNKELAAIGPGAVLGEKFEPMLAISTNQISYKTILNKEGNAIQASDLNEQMLFELIQSAARTAKKIMLWGVPLIALPFIIFTSFIFNCIMLLFYAFIGHSFIKIMRLGQFEYGQIVRIAAIAITPTLLASSILPQYIPSQGTVYFLVAIGYLYYAIRSVTSKQP